jgi:hypothetical protein
MLYVVLSSHAFAAAAADLGQPRPAASICGSSPVRNAEYRYTVKARVRPLLFWTARREVGDAWFTELRGGVPVDIKERRGGVPVDGVTRDAAGNAQRLELLIGTDPARTPMRVNRWGYIAETICDDGAELLGLMTESNEQTIEQAQAKTTGAERLQAVKAIRARYASGRTVTEMVTVSPPATMTYRDLDAVVAMLPARGAPKGGDMPAGAESGFLVAVKGLIHDSVIAYGDRGRERTGFRRTYVYGDRLYDVTLCTSTVLTNQKPAVIESEFQVRNRQTGSTTEFRIAYPAAGDAAEVPVRIVYRPRWWLELELALSERRESNAQREGGR